MNKLRAWYAGLQAREQRMVAFGAIALVIIILFGGILTLQSAVSGAEARNEAKRADLAWMRANLAEVRAAGNDIIPADSADPPVVVVDKVGRAAGLTDSLRGTQPNGSGVRVQLEGASFDTVITWLATLDQRYGLGVDSITVDRTVKPGLINASITLAQSRT